MNNSKSLLMFSTILSFALVAGFSSNLQAKTVWLEQDDFKQVAEGDGDYQPTNFTLTEEEVSLQTAAMKTAAANPQKETVDDKKMPTLTSEGSFLLPTYVLPEAQNDAPKTVAFVDDQNPWRKNNQATAPVGSPSAQNGVALKGVETPALPTTSANAANDKALLESIEKQYQDTTALLESTAKRLAALENGIENLSKNTISAPVVAASAPATAVPADKNTAAGGENKICVTKEVQRAPLLLPLAPIKTTPSTKAQDTATEEETQTASNAPAKKEYVDYLLEVISRNASRTNRYSASDEVILRSIPKEMKISFLPDSADLSSQAFKWIKAFSYNPQRTVGTAVEVRLSPNDLELQSRRFALIKGALLANGLAPRQIRFVFTDRDNDTVILRNIRLPEEQEFLYQTGKNGKISQQIIQKW